MGKGGIFYKGKEEKKGLAACHSLTFLTLRKGYMHQGRERKRGLFGVGKVKQSKAQNIDGIFRLRKNLFRVRKDKLVVYSGLEKNVLLSKKGKNNALSRVRIAKINGLFRVR